ncbi:hypothetical protein O1R50_18715 [Glycomyces luteolus]|uniref:Uncharacterized protein n=1 Tax=Glycomyces luteolus TaxID=2670330 RepID=A0A9X3PDD2_9ACTN|nr:hypothetical protein [Glycomyces luteolus]MDA1361667.1 hypothetical protein [Glycomyces luteolus]
MHEVVQLVAGAGVRPVDEANFALVGVAEDGTGLPLLVPEDLSAAYFFDAPARRRVVRATQASTWSPIRTTRPSPPTS